MIDVRLVNSKGNKSGVMVSDRGQLIVAPLDFSASYAKTLDATGTAFNIAPPITGMQFVITDILLDAGKAVSSSTAGTIVLYEAISLTSTTETKTILSVEMLKNTNRVITGLNLITTLGTWLNIKTTDATVTATIMGYYITA